MLHYGPYFLGKNPEVKYDFLKVTQLAKRQNMTS